MSDDKLDSSVVRQSTVSDAETQPEWTRYATSGLPGLIESANFVDALFAFVKIGMAGRFSADTTVSLDTAVHGFDRRMAEGLVRYLQVRDVLVSAAGGYQLTPKGAALISELSHSQLGFYREAYGPVLENMSKLVSGAARYGVDIQRDGEALGRHCSVGFRYFGNAAAFDALGGLGAKTILDLGCGGAWFLIDACRRDPTVKGIGLDISPEAIEFAKASVAEAGLNDRIRLVVGDAFVPQTWPAACADADALFSVGTLHEKFREGEAAVVALLDRYATHAAGGKLKGMVLGEPELDEQPDPRGADFFLVHILTEQGLPRARTQWLELFKRTKFYCPRVVSNPEMGPPFSFYELRPR